MVRSTNDLYGSPNWLRAGTLFWIGPLVALVVALFEGHQRNDQRHDEAETLGGSGQRPQGYSLDNV